MKRLIWKLMIVFIGILLTSGCVRTRPSQMDIAMQEATRLIPPPHSLKEYATIQLDPMDISAEVRSEEKKISVANDLEGRLKTKVMPLLNNWNSSQVGGQGVLIVKPVLQHLRVISAANRYWLGSMAGDSFIDMDLRLIDQKTGATLVVARVERTASAMGGAYSVGGTDNNLLNYIVDISYQYLVLHHDSPPRK